MQAEFSAGDVRNRLQMVLKENLDPAVVKEIRGIAVSNKILNFSFINTTYFLYGKAV